MIHNQWSWRLLPLSLEEELTKSLRAIRGLRPQRQDSLEDYFHDAILYVLTNKDLQIKTLEEWLGYVYKRVANQIACGQEGRVHLPLEEALVSDERPTNIDLQIDIQAALKVLSPRAQVYVYERFYEGRTLEEIAQKHSVTAQAVDESIKYALKKMRKVLEGAK